MCILFDGEVVRTEADEYVEIANAGDAPQELLDWKLVDDTQGRPQLLFPSYPESTDRRREDSGRG